MSAGSLGRPAFSSLVPRGKLLALPKRISPWSPCFPCLGCGELAAAVEWDRAGLHQLQELPGQVVVIVTAAAKGVYTVISVDAERDYVAWAPSGLLVNVFLCQHRFYAPDCCRC